jgi:uncharacterized protein (TIGR04255 family)
VPSELLAYIVHHRFRAEAEGWPLIQVGPGILTVNDTTGYVWTDFESRISRALKALDTAHPSIATNGLHSVVLRYINAEPTFDSNPSEFAAQKLGVGIEVPNSLFAAGAVESSAIGFDTRLTYRSSSPPGEAQIRIATGQRNGDPAVIWEISVQSSDQVPAGLDSVGSWTNDAHEIVDDWFFKLVAGELLEKYR